MYKEALLVLPNDIELVYLSQLFYVPSKKKAFEAEFIEVEKNLAEIFIKLYHVNVHIYTQNNIFYVTGLIFLKQVSYSGFHQFVQAL
jgi:hypothetical protein